MTFIRRHLRTIAVGATCAAAGAGAGAIATAGAATSSSGHAGTAHRAARAGALRRLASHGVQGSAVVRTKTGFTTVSFERGKVDSVSGQQLTLTEGTPKAAYKTVTVTIPGNAVIRDNRHKATLSNLTSGQRVVVVTAPKRTYVVAHTPKTA